MNKIVSTSLAIALAMLVGCTGGTNGNVDTTEEDGLTQEAIASAKLAGCNIATLSGAELHIYMRSDLIAPNVIVDFESALGCIVIVDTFESSEAMYAKLKAGETSYDIIMPASYLVKAMAKEDMILELDHSKIPNIRKNFDKSFSAQILDTTFKYNVPYSASYGGFIYLKEKVPEGISVDSWELLSSQEYKGKMGLLNNIREVIGAGLMYLGYSINSTNPAEIDAAVEQVLKWRKNIRKFDAESYKTEISSGLSYLAHNYSSDSYQLILGNEEAEVEPHENIAFTLPKEGFSIAFDEMVITKGSQNVGLAYAFLNYLYEPRVAASNMVFLCGPSPVAPAMKLLDEEHRNLIVLDAETLKRGQVIRGFDGKPEVQKLYNKAWDKIQATEE